MTVVPVSVVTAEKLQNSLCWHLHLCQRWYCFNDHMLLIHGEVRSTGLLMPKSYSHFMSLRFIIFHQERS